MSIGYVDPPFGPAIAGRGLKVRLQIMERASGAAWTPKDLSASTRYAYRIRAWDASDLTAFVVNDVVAEGDAAATGWLDDYVPLGEDAHDVLEWELVEVDTSNTDAATPTGDPEVVLMRWRQAIEAAPVAGATG